MNLCCIGKDASVLRLDVAHTYEVVATAAEHAGWVVVVVEYLNAAVRTQCHVEAEGCGLAATSCCRCNNVLELDVELAVLMSVGYLAVAAHIHPT